MKARDNELADQIQWCGPAFYIELQAFAALIRADEREACANICMVLSVHPEYASDLTKMAAQAIRARG